MVLKDTTGPLDLPTGQPRPVRLRAAWWVAFGATVTLSVASMAVPAVIHHPLTRDRGELRLYLDVGEESNLPTWWSTALLVTATLAHIALGSLARARHRRGAWAWFASAAMLGLLSIDEHTSLHERLDRVGRRLVTYQEFPFYWLLPGLAAGATVATALLLLAVRLRGPARWCMIGGCALLFGSALGGELLQGLQLAAERGSGPAYVLTMHAEELGETTGVLLMLAAAAHSLTIIRRSDGIRLDYRDNPRGDHL